MHQAAHEVPGILQESDPVQVFIRNQGNHHGRLQGCLLQLVEKDFRWVHRAEDGSREHPVGYIRQAEHSVGSSKELFPCQGSKLCKQQDDEWRASSSWRGSSHHRSFSLAMLVGQKEPLSYHFRRGWQKVSVFGVLFKSERCQRCQVHMQGVKNGVRGIRRNVMAC